MQYNKFWHWQRIKPNKILTKISYESCIVSYIKDQNIKFHTMHTDRKLQKHFCSSIRSTPTEPFKYPTACTNQPPFKTFKLLKHRWETMKPSEEEGRGTIPPLGATGESRSGDSRLHVVRTPLSACGGVRGESRAGRKRDVVMAAFSRAGGIWKSTLGRGCRRKGTEDTGWWPPASRSGFSLAPFRAFPLSSTLLRLLPPACFPPPPAERGVDDIFFFSSSSCACDGWKPGCSVPDQSSRGLSVTPLSTPAEAAFLIDLIVVAGPPSLCPCRSASDPLSSSTLRPDRTPLRVLSPLLLARLVSVRAPFDPLGLPLVLCIPSPLLLAAWLVGWSKLSPFHVQPSRVVPCSLHSVFVIPGWSAAWFLVESSLFHLRPSRTWLFLFMLCSCCSLVWFAGRILASPRSTLHFLDSFMDPLCILSMLHLRR